MCQSFNCLPRPGSLFDQDAYIMRGMMLVLIAQQERAELDQKKATGKGGKI